MKQRLFRSVSDISLKIKLFLIFFCFMVAIGSVLGFYLFWQSSRLIIQSENQKDQFELKQISSNIDSLFSEIDVITKNLVYGTSVLRILSEDLRSPELHDDVTHQRVMLDAINNVILSYPLRFESSFIYDMHGNYYGGPSPDGNSGLSNNNNLLKPDFYNRIFQADGKLVLGPRNGNNQFEVGRLINSRDNFKPLGVLIVLVNLNSVHDYYNKVMANNDTRFLLFDQDRNSMTIGNSEILKDKEVVANNDHIVNIDGQPFLKSMIVLKQGWVLIKLTSKSSLLKSIGGLREATILVVLIVLLFFFPFSMYISSRITKPIKKLSNLMLHSIKNNFIIKASFNSNDEIGRLSKSYNIMIDEINQLIRNEYMLKLINKENELKMLQSQINPHFLYNTLDTINWASRINGIEEVGQLAESLAQLMRIAIRNDDQTYSIKNEVSYIENYLTIQQYRYKERFKMEMNINPDVLDCPIPKLIIQPLLENVFIHNVDYNPQITHVSLSIQKENDGVKVQIEDNGLGISSERMKEIYDMLHNNITDISHGIINVHRRLVLNNGPHYGLFIQSKDKGTSVHFYLPNSKEDHDAI